MIQLWLPYVDWTTVYDNNRRDLVAACYLIYKHDLQL